MKKILLCFIFLISLCGFSQTEGFESTTGPSPLPSTQWTLGTGNWAVFDNGVGTVQRWGINNTIQTPPLVYAGTNSAYMNRENIGINNTSEDYLATPSTLVPTNAQFRFFARTFTSGNQGTLYQVKIALASSQQDNPASYTLLKEYTEDELTLSENGVQNNFNIYTEKVVDIPATYYGQQVYIALVMKYTQTQTGIGGDRFLVDNARMVTKCLTPTNLVVNPVTVDGGTLTWTNPSGATSWEIEVILATATPTGSGIIYNNPTPTYQLTGLLSNTIYKVYIRALCNPTLPSTWSLPVTFTTATAGVSCASPITIPPTLPYITNNNTLNFGDTTDVTQPLACGGTALNYMTGNDVFYSYTAQNTGPITITLTPSGPRSGIFVYQGCANVGVTCLGGVANTGSGPRVIPLTVTAGQTYIIVISTAAAPQTVAYNLTIVQNSCTNLAATFSLVSNCTPTTTGFFVRANVTNLGTATSVVATDNQTSPSQTITAPGIIDFGPYANGTNVSLHLENGSDPNCFLNSASFTQQFCPFTNDLCANAIPVTCGSTQSQTTVGATTTGAPTGTCGTTAGSGGLWYSYLGNGDVVTASLCNSAFDTRIQVVTGSCGTFTCVAGNDNSCATQSSVQFITTPGVTYYIYVYGTGTAQGVFTLAITCITPPPPPVNDNCATATVVPVNTDGVCTQTVNGTVAGALASSQPNACVGTADDDVWYQFTATATSQVITLSNIAGSALDLNFAVYSTTNQASPCGALTQILCSNPNFSVVAGLTIGNVYLIRVYTAVNTLLQNTTFTLCVSQLPPVPVNNECATAISAPVNPALACTAIVSGTTSGATASPDSSTCTGNEDDDVWFSFVAGSTKHVITLSNIVGTTTNLNHAVYSGACGSLVQKYCSAANSLTSTNSTYITGQTYYIRVWTNEATFQLANFDLCITTPIGPPPCLSNQPAGNTCAEATPICNFNGYCGNTSASYTATQWTQLTAAFCGSLENDSFLSFVATSTTISLDVWVTSSQNGDGIQMLIFSAATCGSGPVTALTCWSPGIVPEDSTVVSATGLIPGNTYYILVDGFAGDVCNYVIAPSAGSGGSGIFTQVVVGTPTTSLCLGQSATLTASGGSGTFNWTPSAGLSATTGSSVVFTPTAVGTYTVTATSPDGNPICPLASSDSETIVVSAAGPSTFNPIAPICVNDTPPVLPTTSIEGYVGTWSPAVVSNTQTGVYIFTPNPGQCGNPANLTVTVNTTPQLPTFNTIPNICQGATAPVLPATSIEGVPGTWSPPSINTATAGTVTYTFTPTPGSCALTNTLNVTVNPTITPTFSTIASVCQGATAPVLPTTSIEGINGTWIPSTIDTSVAGTATYTFTPVTGGCNTTTTLNVTVTSFITTTFTQIPNICQNSTAPLLPTVSNEGVTGSWNAPINTSVVGTTNYTFTPGASFGCASTFVMPITIDLQVIPTFTSIPTLCVNDTPPTLPTTSNNGINGTWNATITTSTAGVTTYIFTPNAGICAATATLNVTVVAPTIAAFTQLGPFCQFDTVNALPTTSNNGIVGTWDMVLSTATPGTVTYTFTPASTACTTGTTMTVVVNPKPVLPTFTPITSCDSYALPVLANAAYYSSPNGVGTPITNVTTTQMVYVYATSGTTPNCATQDSFNVTITKTPEFEISGGCDGNLFVLEAVALNNSYDPTTATYSWTDLNNVEVGTASTYTATVNGVYNLTVSIPSTTCEDTHDFNAVQTACVIQKGISPNGDGLNDSLDLTGFNVKELGIFNRYGQKVYSKNNYTDQWYGQTDKGEELPDGTYYFVIDRNDAETKSGWVYINRVNN